MAAIIITKKEPLRFNEQELSLKNTLLDVLAFNTYSGNEKIMIPYIHDFLIKYGFEINVDSIGNIYAKRGETKQFPMFNAHMDIVHNIDNKYLPKIEKKYKKWSYIKNNKEKEKLKKSCINCAYLTNCIALAIEQEERLTERQVYFQLKKENTACEAWVKDVENDNAYYKNKYEKEEEEILTPHKNSYYYDAYNDYMGYYGYGRYGYFNQEEEDEYYSYFVPSDKPEDIKKANDKINEIYTISFDEITGEIKGSGERVLGGDDKCGVALILTLAKYTTKPMKIFFSVSEEIGCVGVKHAIEHNTEFFKDIRYSVTVDRRGNGDLLNKSAGEVNCSKFFLAELAKYGILADVPINITSGTMADVVYLRKIISETVNISAGYHSPHTRSERIDFPAMCKIYKWLKYIYKYI